MIVGPDHSAKANVSKAQGTGMCLTLIKKQMAQTLAPVGRQEHAFSTVKTLVDINVCAGKGRSEIAGMVRKGRDPVGWGDKKCANSFDGVESRLGNSR